MGLTPPERPSSTTCVAYMYVGGRMGFIGNAIALARGTIAAMDITATIDHIVVMIEKVTAIAVGSVIAASSYARCQRTSATAGHLAHPATPCPVAPGERARAP